jgi:AGCS family alanine or glycine:cation symporter
MMQSDSNDSDITPYQAFCTALGATVGTGNIVGVAGAIAIGGPGAVFWMWVSAAVGMVIKYAEALLAVHYQTTANGKTAAGPMYIIMLGMGNKWRVLAYVYALLGIGASVGIGNSVQINAAVSSIQSLFEVFGKTIRGYWVFLFGFAAAILVYIMLRGGVQVIAATTETLVPVAAGGFVILCMTVLAARWRLIDDALRMIVCGAFSPLAVTGGAVGTFMKTMRTGISRGIFTNEAGLGTAGIAHGCAKVEHPAQQGVLGIVEVFLDTIVICTLTALVILCSGVPIEYGNDVGAKLTIDCFSNILGKWAVIPLTIITVCLALATILGWGLYGARCAQFLFGKTSMMAYCVFQAIAAFCGAVMNTPQIWLLAEILNGLMLLPNILALIHRSKLVESLTRDYENNFMLEQPNRHR